MALVFIVEDDDSIREIEEYSLKTAGYSVTGFDRAATFFDKLESVIPDLILLDIMLPDEDGNNIVKQLRSSDVTRDIPIIMVTAKTTELDLAKGLDNGADDYIKKPFSVVELVSRVKALLRRVEQNQASKIQIGDICLDNEKHHISVAGEDVELTYKEYELLKYLMVNQGIVLDRGQIMDRIWGMDYEGSSRTLDMHIKTLRQKLGDCGSQIRTIRNVGYVLD
ncbi:MAG: response regulator transcription factor [Pseudobutyrivibrio sp.]|nr:response regulator transcription factor [Pseudobutyrivibrio sp.]